MSARVSSSVVMQGRRLRWVRASTSTFEVNEKGCGGKASVRASLSLSIPHVLASSPLLSVIHHIHHCCPSLCGRRAKWARASTSAFEVSKKGCGGKASASASARLLLSGGGFVGH